MVWGYMFSDIKLFFKAGKKARTTDFKWCDYIVWPAEGESLFKKINSEVFSVQCTDGWK